MPDSVISIEEELRHCHCIDGDDLASSGDGKMHAAVGLLCYLYFSVENAECLAGCGLTVDIPQGDASLVTEADGAEADVGVMLSELLTEQGHSQKVEPEAPKSPSEQLDAEVKAYAEKHQISNYAEAFRAYIRTQQED